MPDTNSEVLAGDVTEEQLLNQAKLASEDGYADYSGFKVGAALLTESGDIITGANVENINYTNTGHAETVAMNKAVTDGYRSFVALAIYCSGEQAAPCGMCRQTLAEFCDQDFRIFVYDMGEFTLGELLPHPMKNID